MEQGMFTLSGAPSTTSHLDYLNLSNLDYYILSIFHHLGSPLSYRTLIFDLMRNLYIYNACIYIHSTELDSPKYFNIYLSVIEIEK